MFIEKKLSIRVMIIALLVCASSFCVTSISAFAGDHTVIDANEGTATTVHEDGSVTVADDEGNVAHVDEDGNMMAEDAEGNIVIEDEDGTTVIDPDGDSVTVIDE